MRFSLLTAFLLFFLCSCAHRDLHSFPTRRSSDLSLGPWAIHRTCAGRGPSACRDRRVEHARLGAAAAGHSDRKSTRLNSSHTVISYAVFCLKKKNRRLPATRRSCPLRGRRQKRDE